MYGFMLYLLTISFSRISTDAGRKALHVCMNPNLGKVCYNYLWVASFKNRHFQEATWVIKYQSVIGSADRKLTNERQVKSIFNDPDLGKQWYFFKKNSSVEHLSHELDRVWAQGITGKGIVVGIIDGGIQFTHRDLHRNYNHSLSYNFVSNSSNITPSNSGRPTRMAGLISAESNNNQCGVGAAPDSTFANLQIYDDKNYLMNDFRIGMALSYKLNNIHIYLVGWWLSYNHSVIPMPHDFTKFVLKKGAKYGRNGLGNIFISGPGDFIDQGPTCSFNLYLQRPEIFSFGTTYPSGSIVRNEGGCNAILASSLSLDPSRSLNKLYTTNSGNKCEKSIKGSSAAIAISSGVIALLLSHNPYLTARQVMILIILTSKQYDQLSIKNALGFYYSYYYGFGLLDAFSLLEFSRAHLVRNLAPEHICSTRLFKGRVRVRNGSKLSFYIYTTGCLQPYSCITFIEQVFIVFTITTNERNSVSLYLTSPDGTKFKILEPRRDDSVRSGFHKYRLKLLGYFGERPRGVWKLDIEASKASCLLSVIQLVFHGTCSSKEDNISSYIKTDKYILENVYTFNSSFFSSITYYDDETMNKSTGIDVYSFSGASILNIEYVNILLNLK